MKSLIISIVVTQLALCRAEAVDFYIKEWVLDHDYNLTSGLQVGGWDVTKKLFYILGGNGNQVDMTSEYIYNPSTGVYNVSSTIQPISTYQGQQHTTITVKSNAGYNSYIYFENTNYEYLNENFYVFDMQTNIIKQDGQKPTETIYECFTEDGEYIYIVGGMDNAGNNLKYFSALNIESNIWYKGNRLNIGRVASACIAMEDKIFVFGGNYPINTAVSNGKNTIEMMDKSNGVNVSEWKLLKTIIDDTHLAFPNAFYPVNYGDDYVSNTVFIVSASLIPNVPVTVYSFDVNTYSITKCVEIPLISTINGYLGVNGYIENEYRIYLFGYLSSLDPVPIQYAVLDYNKTNSH